MERITRRDRDPQDYSNQEPNPTGQMQGRKVEVLSAYDELAKAINKFAEYELNN